MCIFQEKEKKKKKSFYHASEKKCSCVVTTILVQELPKYEIQVWDRVDPGHYLDTKLSWKILKKVYRLKRKTKINISCRRFYIVGFVSIKLRNLNCAWHQRYLKQFQPNMNFHRTLITFHSQTLLTILVSKYF